MAAHYGSGAVSTRQLAADEDISYQLACKLMQKLHESRLVESCMGPSGGFRLSREPKKINLRDVITAIQGPIRLNKCLVSSKACSRQKSCPVRKRLENLQTYVQEYLEDINFAEICSATSCRKRKHSK